MPDAGTILARVDRLLAEPAELRAEVVAVSSNDLDDKGVANVDTPCADDLSPENLIDTHAAAARFGFPRDTVARWCREGCGLKHGGRWMASVPRLRRRINGK